MLVPIGWKMNDDRPSRKKVVLRKDKGKARWSQKWKELAWGVRAFSFLPFLHSLLFLVNGRIPDMLPPLPRYSPSASHINPFGHHRQRRSL